MHLRYLYVHVFLYLNVFFQAFELIKLPVAGWKIDTQIEFAHLKISP